MAARIPIVDYHEIVRVGLNNSTILKSPLTRYRPNVLLALVVMAWAFSCSLNAQKLKESVPNLDSILDSLERTEEENPARSRPHEVTRQYKVFRGDDPTPSSEVTAQISFTPPDIKTFRIIEEQGNPRGKKIVSVVLEQEV